MKIIFDNSWDGSGGIGRFTQSIFCRLNNKVLLVLSFCKPASFKVSLQLSIYSLFKNKDCVLFLPGYIPPLFSKIPFVFTIHDLNHIDRAENSSFLKCFFYFFVIKPGCHKAKYILTVSEFSRKRIIDWSGVSPEKVVNVGNGVDESFNITVQPFTPGYRYLLCVSNRKLHKNEPMLIRAFAQASVEHDLKLVITGDTTAELEKLLDVLDISDRVVFIGRVKDSELPGLYKGSLGLVFPSLYEGFGLPVVEAMACGVPVLTSNTTSLPEVAGESAILVNPESIDEIRTGIERLTKDQALRTDLIAKGLERAKLFSWDAVAARVQAVLEEVANKHEK